MWVDQVMCYRMTKCSTLVDDGDTAHAAVPTCMHAHRYIYKLCLCGHGGEFCQIFYTAELQLQLLCLNIYTFESEMNKSLC